MLHTLRTTEPEVPGDVLVPFELYPFDGVAAKPKHVTPLANMGLIAIARGVIALKLLLFER